MEKIFLNVYFNLYIKYVVKFEACNNETENV